MDSSVIFLVVLGLWAVYLVPHWLRRREDLSASRSVDRFSAAMRVLSRRPAPEELPDRPRTSAYVLAPVRESAALTTGLADAGVELAADPVAAPSPALPSGRRPRRVPARALAAVLLLSVLAVPVLGALSVLGLIPVWAAAPAAVVAVVAVAALRAYARRRRRASRTTVPPHAVTVVAAVDVVVPADELQVAPREELFDEEAHTAREEQARIRRLAEETLRAADVPSRQPEPGEWTPVAVPLPAYLLKPHARPAWQAAPVPAALPARPARARVCSDVDEDDIPTYAPPARWVAGA